MSHSILQSCLPWLAVLALALVAARLLTWLSRARLEPGRVRRIHQCEKGSVQSLGFVLTLPFFLMIIMLIVQVSQIMMANVLVHYGAFTSARSAVVWIPANGDLQETANRISSFNLIQRTSEGSQYRVNFSSDSEKLAKIRQAAVLACIPLAPSRDLGYQMDADTQLTGIALARLYLSLIHI